MAPLRAISLCRPPAVAVNNRAPLGPSCPAPHPSPAEPSRPPQRLRLPRLRRSRLRRRPRPRAAISSTNMSSRSIAKTTQPTTHWLV